MIIKKSTFSVNIFSCVTFITEAGKKMVYTVTKLKKGRRCLMKGFFYRVLRPLLFAAGGAVVGVAYYYPAGCATGACPITASPVTTAIYTAVIGLLLSMVLTPCRGESCDA